MARVVAECRPAFVFAENVALAAFQEPYRDLVAMGYRVPPALQLSAGDLGAPFERKRWWLLASDLDGDWQHAQSEHAKVAGIQASGDADGSRLAQRQGEPGNARTELPAAVGATWRAPAPRLRRLVSGSARGVDARRARISAVGNAQVPAVAAAAFSLLMRGESKVTK